MNAPANYVPPAQDAADSSAEGRTDLRTLLSVLRRNVWIIVLCVGVAGGVTYAVSKGQAKQYSASATVLVRTPAVLPSPFIDPSNTPERDAATNFGLASQPIIERQARQRLVAQGNQDAADAISGISLSGEGNTDLLKVKASAATPAAAALAANTFAYQYIAFRRTTDQQQVLDARQLVNNQVR